MRILLVGNPNVGKSVIFSQLTGTRVISSNYPGTTVEYTRGYLNLDGERVEVIDVPGSYTLEPTCKAEEVAVAMLPYGDVIINVVDATNLERNLYLTLELLERKVPVLVALNLWDEAQHKGILIDAVRLEEILEVPVVTTAAISGQGMKRLIERLPEARTGRVQWQTTDERFATVGRIVREVQQVTHRHHTLLEQLEDLSVMPVSGFFLGAAVLFGAFKAIRFIGEGLIGSVFEPFFNQVYAPLLEKLSLALGEQGFLHSLLIGQLVDGKIDFVQSLGLLSTGLYIPLAMVFPYIIAFYAVLGFLEDFGYLPRLAVLLDGLMHRVGLHGYAIIPMVLGLGCNVPAALSIRNLESRRQKFIASTLMVTAIPCFSQTAMIFALLGRHGGFYVAHVFLTLLCVWVVLGLLLNRWLKGFTPSLLVEIPPYRIPEFRVLAQKLHLRLTHFFKEAIPFILAGILVVNLACFSGLINLLARTVEPLFRFLFGLPGDAATALLLGFLRKDVALGILIPLHLTPEQLVVASTILAIYFPCLATFLILWRELAWRDMLKVTGIMLTTALAAGTFTNLALQQYGVLVWLSAAVAVGILVVLDVLGRKKAVAVQEET
ncbi:MAG: ferrous iron transporter B [Thermoanaerobacteraceae bacterium]|nr:ferrous iron transporter B [Thermoanaerobacteraceae bacterium]